MKSISKIILSIIAAYLICDPQIGVKYYVVLEDGQPKRVEAQTDGSLKMENPLSTAKYMAAACNDTGCSETTALKIMIPKNFRGE